MHQRLLARTRAVYIWLMAPLLGFAVFLGVLATVAAPVATAATSSNLNFQARLLTNTGAVVPDGNYNIEFKIYTADGVTGSQGSCSGSCVWMESRTVAGGTSVQVINGYFSVNLGSVNAFGAGINWDQQLWLTMRIGGTAASPSWDAEMQNSGHSIALTALPYAFVAAQLAKTDGSGNRGTLSFGSVTNNPVIQLPNESGTVCTTAASGVCNTAGGLTNVAYLNQTQTFTGTNTFQPSTNISSLIVKQTTVASPTADVFDVQTVNNSKVIAVTTTGTDNASLRLASVGAGSTVLLQGDDEKISFSGTESRILIDTTGSGISNFIDFFRNSNTTSSRRLRVFKGDGTSTETFGIDASNGNILMGNNLDLETAGSLTIGGSTATTVTLGSTTASSGSQTFNIGNNATAGTYASTVNVGSTLNASTTTIKGGSGGINLSPSGASNSGVLVKPGTDSTAAFQVQNAASSKAVMTVDTTGGQLVLGTAGTGGVTGKLKLFNSTSGSTGSITLQAADPATTNYTITIPGENGTLCTTAGSAACTAVYSAAGSFVNLAPAAAQADSSTNSSIFINKTGASGNILDLQKASADALVLDNSGRLVLGATTTAVNLDVRGTAANVNVGTATARQLGASQTGYVTSNGTETATLAVQTGIGFVGSLNNGPFCILTNNICRETISNTGATTFKPGTDSATTLQVQNASSSKTVMAVDTTNNQLLLGTAGASGLNGKLVFNTTNASNTTITIQAASTASSYSLTLPTVGPALGQCLQNDGTTVGQLTFGACGASGTFLNKNATDTSSANAGSGFLYSFTNSGSAGSGGVLSLDNGTNTGTILSAKGTSTTAFQVMDNNSHKVITVDTSNSVLRLGQASTVNGGLVFQNSGNSNGVTLNTTGGSSNYTLTLPTAAPAGGLCIETSTGNSSQLVFASCSNNNASIQQVNYWDANNTSTVSSVSPTTVGDELILTTQIPTSGVTVSSISGGGVTTWTKVASNAGNGTVNRVELWVGTVTSTGSSPVSVTYCNGATCPSSPGSNEITVNEFTAAGVNASTSWGIESSSTLLNNTVSPTVTYPSATAVNGSELYYGYAQVSNPPANAGSSSGFSYTQTSTQHNMITYNTSLVANTTYQPTATQNVPTGGQSNTIDVVLTAFVTSTSINNTTSLQKANFYVQAASAGSVAGVLQAASSGSADIMDLRDSSGNNVFSVGPAGDVLVKPAASATAFQVQNGSGYSVLGVDTSGSQVTLGDATHLSGKITFKDSSDTNTISIQAPSSVAATYTLSLPTNTPTAGLCLGTSPSNANQLIFASCATQVSAASITYINQWSNSGTNITTLADSPASVGNLLVLFTHSTNNVSIPGGGVAGGGVTNWTKVTSNVGAAGMGNDEMWRGVVTTTGSSTITISSYSGAGVDEITAQEYTMGGTGGGTWAIDTSGTNTGTSTTINYPSLTPANSSELYAGYAWSANTPTPSGTSGYTYTATNSGKYTVRNTSVTGGVATQPQSTQTSGNFNSIAAVIQAFAGTSVIVNSTATQQANFNVQAALSGTVAGVLQGAASGSADVLQVKDGSGNNVMAVNGTSGVTLGTSTVAAGTLVFNAAGNSNTITITAPLTPGTSYTLKLPSAAAAPGQCLAASPSDFQQLVFSSCANQVTSVAISFVNNWKNSGSSISTLNISPANLNDIIVVFSSPRNGVSTTGISGCSITWSKVSGSTAGSGADTSAIDMYKGVVNATGACTLTATFSGSQGNPNEIAAMEFTTGSSTGSWVVDASNAQYNGTANTTAAFPSLTPQSSRDLYVGYGAGGTFSGTVSSGYTYVAGNLTNRAGIYNTNVNAATSPTATQTSSASITVGALIAAYSSSSVISNSTVTQQANFNIQAATSGSVAGVLQAFPTGTGDILELLDGSGTLTDKFDYQGNLLVRPSTAGATAFQVQNTSSVNVLSVDTSAKQVVIGAGSTGESTVSLLVLDNRTGSSADPSGVNGAMYYNATTHNFRCYAAGAWQNCGGLLSSNTSQSSANNNCSNNCGAFSTFASVPANYCQAGRVIKLNAHGYFSSQVSATNLQFGVYYGTDNSVASNDTLIGTLTPTVSVTSASNNYFGLDFDVTCFSTTSMQADGLANIQVGAAASGVIGVPISSTSPTTVVSTSAKNLYIFPIWGAASTSNTAKITQFIVTAP